MMPISKQKIYQLIGALGAIASIAAFIKSPSFPTPDKLLIFMTFIFMTVKQALSMLRRFLPFVAVLLVYESFRGMADKFNNHIDFLTAPHFDQFVFKNLPTIYLQDWLWRGHTMWYDFVFYFAYLLHFILPITLAVIIWKLREKQYWQFVNTYLVVAFGAFVTFFLLPAAPPWMASDLHYIPHITRISSDVWAAMGLKNFPSVYNHISPNPVAAIPSLHSAWATLLVIFVYKNFGKRWALVSAIYPLLIYVGTIYEGEHYAFDVLAGILYGVAGYLLTPWLMRKYWTLHKTIKPKNQTVFGIIERKF